VVFVLPLEVGVLYLVCCDINQTLIVCTQDQPTKDYQH